MVSSRSVCAAALALLLVAVGRSQTTISWANLGSPSSDLSFLTNWIGVPGTVTYLDGTLALSFDSAATVQPSMSANVFAYGVQFTSNAGNFTLTGNGTLSVGTGGLSNQATGPQRIDVDLGFNTTTPTITNNGTLTLNGKVLNNAAPLAMTITNNGTLTLAGGIANNGTLGMSLAGNGSSVGTVSGVISGTQPLAVQSGNWTFSGTNTLSGTLTLSGGLLTIATDSNLGAVPSSVTANALTFSGGTLETTATMTLASNRGVTVNSGGATLQVDPSTTLTYGGVITGTGSLTKTGNGTLTLSGGNTLSGQTIVSAGTLTDAAANAFSPNSALAVGANGTVAVTLDEAVGGLNDSSAAGGNVTIANGKTLTLKSGGSFSGAISGAGTLAVATGAAETLAGNATQSGGTSIANGGSLQIGNGGTTGSVTGAIVNNGNLTINRADNVSYGSISGSGALHKQAAGTLTLTGGNTYSGTTDLQAGTLADGAAGAFSANSALSLAGTSAVIVNYNEAIAGLSGWTSSSGSTVALNAALSVAPTNSGTGYYGAISGTGSLVLNLNGNSTVLGGASTYSGGTSVNNGTLILQNTSGSGTGTGAVTVASNAQVQLGNGSAGGYTLSDIANSGTVVFSSTTPSYSYGGAISGSGSVVVGTSATSGTTFTLTGLNTYTGSTYVNKGTLRIGAVNTLPSSSNLQLSSGTTLDVANSQTLKSIGWNDSANITLGNASTLTLSPETGQYGGTLNATISGMGGFSFAGASGTSTVVAGNNTYSGGTSILSGTVYILGNTALGSGTVTLQPGSTLAVAKDATADSTLANAFVLSDGATLGDGTDNGLLINGAVQIPGGTPTLHVGQYTGFLGNLSAASSSQLTVDSASGTYGHLVIGGTVDPSLTAITASQAGVVFSSSASVPATGALTLKGTNAYVGIAAGTASTPTAASVLSLIDSANFTGVFGFDTLARKTTPTVFSDPVDVSRFGSNLTLGSSSDAVLSGTITPSSSGYLFGNGGGGLILNSALTGAYNLTVDSTTSVPDNDLILVLHGNNSFSGSVTVNNSELVLDSGGALPAGTTVSLGANGYLGYTEAFTSAANFNGFVTQRLAAGGYTSSSVLGIDSDTFVANYIASGQGSGSRTVTDTIDLRSLGPIGLGTITRATLSGQIYAPNQSGANLTLALLGINEGQLTITSNLAAGQVNSVVVGTTSSTRADGVVILSGENTYAGGTTLKSGDLLVSGYSTTSSPSGTAYGPLGTGTVTINGGAKTVTLAGTGNYTLVNNAISLGRRLFLGFATGSGNPLPRGITSGMLTLSGVISDIAGSPGSLSIYSNVGLEGANTFSGGVELHAGTVALGTDTSLGSGTVTFTPGTDTSSSYVTLYSSNARTLANPLVYSGATKDTVYFSGGPFTLNGSLVLNTDVQFASWSAPVYFNGSISGNGRFYGVGSEPIYLSGSNSFTGGVESDYGAIVFSSASALPTSGGGSPLLAQASGYIGISYVPANLQSDFINRFDKSHTYGAIGFDSASRSSPNTFSGSIDLSNFSSYVRLGSSSAAILTGTITPQGNTYQFGNGGGTLEVASALTDGSSTRAVSVSSTSGAPLTLRLTGANTFTGGLIASGSAVVFGAGALPASGYLTGTTGSNPTYIGTEDSALFAANPANFITHFSPGASNLIVGFDKFTVTGDVDLTRFTNTSDPQIAVGTTSTATLSGNLFLPGAQADYRFAGYKGGQLTVGGTLAGAHGVVVGASGATRSIPGDYTSQVSAVTLTAANTYTGNTTIAGGELWVGNDSALGTGALIVPSTASDAALYASGGARTLANAIAVATTLNVGGANALSLSGSISGAGELEKTGTGTLTLSGANSWTGGMLIDNGTVTFASGSSIGSGYVDLSSATAQVNFNDSTTVNGLSAENTGSVIGLAAGKTLTINEPWNSYIAASITGSTAGLVVTGGKELELAGANTFAGPVTLQGNAVLIANSATALGASSNPVTVNSGTLVAGSGITVANPITLTAGALAGTGTFKAALGSSGFNIGSGATLAPGIQGTGTLNFDGSLISTSMLILNSGGTYTWELRDAADATNGWDKITVNGTVNIAATSASPFNFSLRSIGPSGAATFAANFDPSQAYSWTLLSATAITGFTGANQFAIDASSFLNSNGGQFTLGLSGNSLVLNFSPVPEPSTYLLMLAGLGVTAFAARRRRR